MKFFEWIFDVINRIKIVLSPLLLSVIIAAVIYAKYQTPASGVIGIIIILSGLIRGLLWANHIHEKYGASEFMSGIAVPPEKVRKEKEQH